MESTQYSEIKNQARSGVLFLTIRNLGIQAVSTLGFFILTLILGAGEVGLFAIVAESVSILGYFSDVGLASALIQKKIEPTLRDLRTVFTIQQILIFIALIVLSFAYQQLSLSKNYGQKEFYIVIALSFSFVAASLKTIPSILLERHLNFKSLSTVDIIENTSFYISAVVFALLGFGVYSYVIATIFRSILGLIIIYRVSPWNIGLDFDFVTLKQLFKYGIPFQLNSLIAMAKDRISSLFVAGIIGRESFGIISWAQKGPRIPLSLMDSVMRVSFPAFSRMQSDPKILSETLSKSIFFISFVTAPVLVGISIIAPDIINIIPKYQKWLPAVIPLYFYSYNALLASVTTPITNAFNSIGKITLTTRLMIMWTILTWLFYPYLSQRFGYLGTSYATGILATSSIVVWIIARNIFNINVLLLILHPIIASSFFLLTNFIPYPNLFISIISKVLLSTVIYFLYFYIFKRQDIQWISQQFSKTIFRR